MTPSAEELLMEEQKLRHNYATRAARAEAFLENLASSHRCECEHVFRLRDRHAPGAICNIIDGVRDILCRREA